MWNLDPLYKFEQSSIANNLLETLTNFLINRKQKLVLASQYSTGTNVKDGIPQGSIYGPLLLVDNTSPF